MIAYVKYFIAFAKLAGRCYLHFPGIVNGNQDLEWLGQEASTVGFSTQSSPPMVPWKRLINCPQGI